MVKTMEDGLHIHGLILEGSLNSRKLPRFQKKNFQKLSPKKSFFWREKKKIKMEKNGDWGLSEDWGIGSIYRSMSTTIPNPRSQLLFFFIYMKWSDL